MGFGAAGELGRALRFPITAAERPPARLTCPNPIHKGAAPWRSRFPPCFSSRSGPWISATGDAQGRRMAEDENGEVPKLPPDARLGSLDERLDRLQRRDAEKAAKAEGDANSSAGRMVLSQLIGGPLGGAIVGWVLDRWLGTAPWVMLGLMFVGF